MGNRGEILSPLCCYFSWPASKVRTPNARVVRAPCLLSMCHRRPPERERAQPLSAPAFARGGGVVTANNARLPNSLGGLWKLQVVTRRPGGRFETDRVSEDDKKQKLLQHHQNRGGGGVGGSADRYERHISRTHSVSRDDSCGLSVICAKRREEAGRNSP